MSKKLIVLAVAAVFSAPAAMADVMVYGSIHMDIRANDEGNSTQNTTVNNNGSSLGFKGAEDLGNGLKAIFKYDMTYSGLDSATAIGDANDSYIGLTGSFGTFLVGRHNTPAKSAYYASGNDHLGDSIIDLNEIGFTERRVSNAIAYVSPNFSGVRIAAAIVPGEQSGADDTTDENGLMDSYSLGVMYQGHGVKAGLGYESIGDQKTTTAANGTTTITNGNNNYDATTLHIGASYTFMSNYTVGVQYSNEDNYDHADGDERTTFALAGKAQFGNNAIILNYGDTETESNTAANNAEATHMGIGFHHTMSKRTSAYVAYKNVDPDGGDSTDQFAVGMIHNF